MKTCSKCKENLDLKNFLLNDYGKPISWCRDCLSKKSLENYYRKKGINTNEGLQSESVNLPMKNETKCKDFFFYQHIL